MFVVQGGRGAPWAVQGPLHELDQGTHCCGYQLLHIWHAQDLPGADHAVQIAELPVSCPCVAKGSHVWVLKVHLFYCYWKYYIYISEVYMRNRYSYSVHRWKYRRYLWGKDSVTNIRLCFWCILAELSIHLTHFKACRKVRTVHMSQADITNSKTVTLNSSLVRSKKNYMWLPVTTITLPVKLFKHRSNCLLVWLWRGLSNVPLPTPVC